MICDPLSPPHPVHTKGAKEPKNRKEREREREALFFLLILRNDDDATPAQYSGRGRDTKEREE